VKCKVLIADPDELLTAACRAFLAAEGIEVVTVTNLPDCRAALRRAAPDLFILDPEVAWQSGAEIQELLGDDVERLAIPVLLLTSRPEKVAQEHHSAHCGLLIKPVSPAAVARLVRALAASYQCPQTSSV
jgi:DNA-binding response OmpR family regulator